MSFEGVQKIVSIHYGQSFDAEVRRTVLANCTWQGHRSWLRAVGIVAVANPSCFLHFRRLPDISLAGEKVGDEIYFHILRIKFRIDTVACKLIRGSAECRYDVFGTHCVEEHFKRYARPTTT